MDGSGDILGILRNLSWANLGQIALIVAVTWALSVASQRLLAWLADRLTPRYRLLVLASVPVLRLVLIIAAIVLIIPRVVEPTFQNLAALLGALGLALGFALKDYISSLIAGIVALYETPYRPGDWIRIDGAYGEVTSTNMRSAEILTADDTVVIIPNLKLWDHLVFNANDGGPDLLCVTDFYLHPRHDAAQAKQALYDVALTSPFLQIERPISVIVMEEPWGTHYRLKAYPVNLRQQFHFITDLTIRGKAALEALGIEFVTLPAVSGP